MHAQRLSPIRILIVEDHPIVRLGIRQMISEDPALTICGEADSAARALDLVSSTSPALALVDMSLPDGSGLDLIGALIDKAPALKVLALSMHDETLFAERALRAGARGYVMKDAAVDCLLHAIHEVMAGRVFVSPRMSQVILERLGREPGASDSVLGSLTDRELDVFEQIGRGLSTSAIAGRLKVSVKTVETHRSNIKTKLHLKDGTELIRCATAWLERV